MVKRLLSGLAILLVTVPALAAGPLHIELEVDAREAPRRILHATLRIPVVPGPMTLVYPKWLPGTHGPTGPITDLVGIRMSIAGQPLPWQRDSLDLYAFHIRIPEGAGNLDVSLDLVSGLPDSGMASPASLTTGLALVKWSQVMLYPAGVPTEGIEVAAGLTLPDGWDFATALDVSGQGAPAIRFAPVSLSTLVDSPLLAGRYLRRLVLDDSARPVTLVAAADSPADLRIPPGMENQLRRLVRETDALFGARHFRRYQFLVALSDKLAQFGLESHESSENRVAEDSFGNPAVGMLELFVLPHEYVHSWNGKYRRPVGLTTPDFQVPMRGDLLWVYEGLTQYLGHLLAARSGLWTPERYRDRIAQSAAYYSLQPGRRWRSLADTAVSAQQLSRASPLWRSYRRSTDYYNEGALVWLEADMLIRQESRGLRSLDDFCRGFFGGRSGPPEVVPYTEGELYAALNAVLAWDWPGFFAARIAAIDPPAPVGGLERGGWRLALGEKRNGFLQDVENHDPSGMIDLAYSLGFRLTREGLIDDLMLDSPAATAGLAPGMQLRAVNGRRWTAARLREAIAAGQQDHDTPGAEPATGRAPGSIDLLVENGDRFETLNLRYAGGLREPQLERLPSIPDRLGASIAPRTR